MDVDLLRPGTVPISKDTSLWFEFVLNPDLLVTHLQNPAADPTPTELIIKFLTLSLAEKPIEHIAIECNGIAYSKPRLSRRCHALKILALKITAYLHWDLEIIENKLPLPLQATLLKDFLNVVSPIYGEISTHITADFNSMEPQVLFAIFLYHRWVLKAFANSMLNGKTKLNGVVQNEIPCEDVSEAASERSVEILKLVSMAQCSNLLIPSIDCFGKLTEHLAEAEHQWELGTEISFNQFQCQVLMDITSYLMFRESYNEACSTLKRCCTAFQEWKKEPDDGKQPYCTVTREMISGHCMAAGIPPAQYTPSLVQQYHKLFSEQYMSIERVLERDNLTKEIPQLYRDSIELDVTSEMASGKITVYRDALTLIQASNMVRRALEGGSWQAPKVTPSSLQKALLPVIPRATELERKRLKYLVGTTLVNGDIQTCRELMDLPATKQLLTPEEIDSAVEPDYADPMPHVLSGDLESNLANKHKSPSLQIAAVERILTTSYDPPDIKAAIVKLASRNMNLNMGKLNRNWEIPIPLHTVTNSLGGSISHHYIYVLLAKAYELDRMKNYGQARAMMRSAMDELSEECGSSSQTANKLNQLILWEVLLIDIHQFHSEWPAKHLDWTGLTQRCIAVLHKVEGCLPRITLREECALTLLNTGQWTALITAPQIKHSAALADLYLSIAIACEDITKFNKKVTPDAWDKILVMFAINSQKRRDSLNGVTQALCAVIELNALVMIISLLAKLHNILIDQSPLDLHIQWTQIWPNSIKNANQYSLKFVSEVLMDVLEHALKHYPNNVQWLKLMGDLHFANGHHTSALKSYIEAAIAGTEYFSRPLHKNVIEDYIYKRMIKSCTVLQCHTQAGILCQFLEDVDYATAFKSLSEGGCSDSMDSYYDCIWDVNILEFLISYHTKRGEHHRKQKVIRTIGLLELNSNNNDEIKREAENIRKGRFMRAMAAQYLS